MAEGPDSLPVLQRSLFSGLAESIEVRAVEIAPDLQVMQVLASSPVLDHASCGCLDWTYTDRPDCA